MQYIKKPALIIGYCAMLYSLLGSAVSFVVMLFIPKNIRKGRISRNNLSFKKCALGLGVIVLLWPLVVYSSIERFIKQHQAARRSNKVSNRNLRSVA